MTSASDDPDEIEIHPQYDVSAHIDELFSVPAYRQPENALIERWRELGERLLALGERHLVEGVEAADEFLEGKLEARRRRRHRRRIARRRAAQAQAQAAQAQAAQAQAAQAQAAQAQAAQTQAAQAAPAVARAG